MRIDKLEEEYVKLWETRELVLTLSPEMGIEACVKVGKKIHKEIEDYFQKIKKIDDAEKFEIYNKLINIYSKLTEDDNLFERVLSHYTDSRVTKTLINVCTSSSTALINGIKLIDFDLRKKVDYCNCQLKQEIELKIQNQPLSVKKIRDFSDGYYEYELYRCYDCKTFWINDRNSYDGPPQGWRKPNDKHELNLIDKYINRFFRWNWLHRL